jgi:hypothetical protein
MYWDAHWRTEPLKSNGATVDHIISEDNGGYDTIDNLVACCVVCNSSKGKGERNLSHWSLDRSWDGGCSIFLTLALTYISHLSINDKKWLKTLEREGIKPDGEDVQAKIDMILKMSSTKQFHLAAVPGE